MNDVFATVAAAGDFASWNPTIRASRRLDAGEIGEGSLFEWELRGFGRVVQEFKYFERNVRVRIVPHMKGLEGGHLFRFSAQGDSTRIDHELEMTPKGAFRPFAPMMAAIGRQNLRDTAEALREHPEGIDTNAGSPYFPVVQAIARAGRVGFAAAMRPE